ncbi:MAG TPA: DUF5309 family protein [Anaerohalosphaeraceae bacterium]|nr:DUF5309 family protein [Anaerohalosphaeraceae bacterium]HQI07531.1 DUF5309 family protein [Anaerohalosphaeraceae bacterium]HQJ67763.1 DUF5309 family protein [Anaerohalosphaeraceae bacterium]
MAFTGKATYIAGPALPELAEDVSDLVGIISPFETPLLDALGDPSRSAASTRHEWLEDTLLPNKDSLAAQSLLDPLGDTELVVNDGGRFRVGDQIQMEGKKELMLVTQIAGNTISVIRGYAGTNPEAAAAGQIVNILGNAALEGAERPQARFTCRQRRSNWTQIFTHSVEVSGTDLAASPIGLADEMDYQKQMRLRELLRDLENTVINGGRPASTPQGSETVRRTLRGIIQHLQTHLFHVGQPDFPTGDTLDETKLNYVLRKIWETSSSTIDLIAVNGFQKRKINGFLTGLRSFGPADTTYRDQVSFYESDFGLCRIVTTRWMPQDAVLLLDSSRISVLPLAGRSFHYKPLASGGDYECGQLIGEYTLELKNEAAHGMISGLASV